MSESIGIFVSAELTLPPAFVPLPLMTEEWAKVSVKVPSFMCDDRAPDRSFVHAPDLRHSKWIRMRSPNLFVSEQRKERTLFVVSVLL
ncbi:hypothetical protein NPIL_547891 [Nephila pilipes]|uniref:Uncharacterized protein n=1 Tax=Nephila pilipes TaxID=299642 RepID=A0A8X6PWF7_NEPPI|nr:hypothetical protein NPIL_547891 [Nephila pilipes]